METRHDRQFKPGPLPSDPATLRQRAEHMPALSRVMETKHTPIDWYPDTCLWCGQYVASCRQEAGAPERTQDTDPCWAVNDDFGCAASPLTNKEGTGDHVTMQELRHKWPVYAAVPDMLAALQHASRSEHHPACPNDGQRCSCHVFKARAAIVKATEQSD